MKVEVAVLGSRPYKPTVSVDVKQHSTIRLSRDGEKGVRRCGEREITEVPGVTM